MINRIKENEERLDKISFSISNLEKALDDFTKNINELALLNKYYGSKEWFKDKDDYEKGKIKNIKAGVLSEDAIWDLDEKTRDLINRMDGIVKLFNENRPK